jgi:Flp pilus assembly protein TadG
MTLSAIGKVKRWLLQTEKEPRHSTRVPLPDIVVHYWDGSAPEGRHIRDISDTGAYIYTPERWYLGTIIRITLQGYDKTVREDGSSGPTASISVPARVVRHGADGVAVEFAFRDKEEGARFRVFLGSIPVQPGAPATTAASPGKAANRRGQALIEFSLIVPLVFLLAVNALNFGGFIFAWITVADAARAGAQFLVMSHDSPGAPTPANLAQITTLVTNDVSSLLNRASVVVAICTNNTIAVTGCTSLIDPEAPLFTLATVDVTYTYKPFVPLFSFPALGISATLPSSVIHRKAVMRMLQ